MNPSSVDIKEMLEQDSTYYDVMAARTLFIGREPATPDNCVTIFDTPGFPPMQTLKRRASAEDLGENYYYPSIQVRVRHTDYVEGWEVINLIKEALHSRAQETWGATLYSSIACSQEPAFLDWDQNHRARFVATFNIQRS